MKLKAASVQLDDRYGMWYSTVILIITIVIKPGAVLEEGAIQGIFAKFSKTRMSENAMENVTGQDVTTAESAITTVVWIRPYDNVLLKKVTGGSSIGECGMISAGFYCGRTTTASDCQTPSGQVRGDEPGQVIDGYERKESEKKGFKTRVESGLTVME